MSLRNNWLTVKKTLFILIRLSVVGLMLWVGWGSVVSVSSLFQQRPQSQFSPSLRGSSSEEISPEELVAFDLEGFWVFAGIPLAFDFSGDITSFEANVEDLIRRCRVAPLSGVLLDSSFSEVLENAESSHGANSFGLTRTSPAAGIDLFQYRSGDLNVAVCIHQHSGQLSFLGGVLSTRDASTNTKRTYRMLPSASMIHATEYLIPSEADPIRVASRLTKQGRVLMEISIVSADSWLLMEIGNKENESVQRVSSQESEGVQFTRLGETDHGTIMLAHRH